MTTCGRQPKGAYKAEPAIADGGEVVIYAPALTEVSYVHGALIDEIGYHCKEYFTEQWERFKGLPGRNPRALDAREGAGDVRSADACGAVTDSRHARDGHPGVALPADQSGVSRSGDRGRGDLGERGTRAIARRAARRGDVVSGGEAAGWRLRVASGRLEDLETWSREDLETWGPGDLKT